MLLNEIPKLSEAVFVPVRIDDEVAGHTIAHPFRDGGRLHALANRRILGQALETGIRSRLETQEDIEVPSNSAPGLEEVSVLTNKIGP